MGFLCRQGRIKMEVVLGLLIVIGAMLEGTEGLKCYISRKAGDKPESKTCLGNACSSITDGNKKVLERDCKAGVNIDCFKREFSAKRACVNNMKQEDLDKYNKCVAAGRTTSQDITEHSLSDSFLGGAQTGRQNSAEQTLCLCWSDNCNPAGRSTPNAQVILGVLVAASLYAFNTGLGYL